MYNWEMVASTAPHSASARRQGASVPPGDIRGQVQQLTLLQQRFERSLARELAVDAAGLETMDYLISSGTSTPTELARRTGLSTAAMTLVLNRLEQAGHVRRERHPSDGRKLVVTPAERSAHQAEHLVEPLIAGVESAIAALTPAERQTVETFLAGVIDAYDRATVTE